MRKRSVLGGLGLAATLSVSVSACGNSISVPLPPTPSATLAPPPAPTSTPQPTFTPIPTFNQVAAWKAKMIQITSKLRTVAQEMRSAGTDMFYFQDLDTEGHLQNAKDTISTMLDEYQLLVPPSGYQYVNWLVGQALGAYGKGIDEISVSLANDDVATFNQGISDLRAGDRDLARANSAFYSGPPTSTPKKEKKKSGPTGPSQQT